MEGKEINIKENIVRCLHCGNTTCYETIIETFKNYSCISCGFTTNNQLTKSNPESINEYKSLLPELYKDLEFIDIEGKSWFPSVINLPTKGMIFCNGTSTKDWKWAGVKAIPVLDEEKEKYPIPNKKGEYYSHRMDMSTLKHFERNEFVDACIFIGMYEEGVE